MRWVRCVANSPEWNYRYYGYESGTRYCNLTCLDAPLPQPPTPLKKSCCGIVFYHLLQFKSAFVKESHVYHPKERDNSIPVDRAIYHCVDNDGYGMSTSRFYIPEYCFVCYITQIGILPERASWNIEEIAKPTIMPSFVSNASEIRYPQKCKSFCIASFVLICTFPTECIHSIWGNTYEIYWNFRDTYGPQNINTVLTFFFIKTSKEILRYIWLNDILPGYLGISMKRISLSVIFFLRFVGYVYNTTSSSNRKCLTPYRNLSKLPFSQPIC